MEIKVNRRRRKFDISSENERKKLIENRELTKLEKKLLDEIKKEEV